MCRGLRVYSVCHGCLIGACLGEGKWMFGGEGKRENSECLGREKVRENGKRERGGEMGVGRGMCK